MSDIHTCDQCGVCCRLFLINLDEEEYNSGKFETVFDGIATVKGFDDARECGANFLAQHESGSCKYLVNNSCSIHESRPKVCRNFFCKSDEDEYRMMREAIREEKGANSL